MFSSHKEKLINGKEKLVTVISEKAPKRYARLNGSQRLKESCFIIGLLFSILITVSLLSFDPADPSWSQTSWNTHINNAAGSVGAWLADTLLFGFGYLAYLLPAIILGLTWIFFRNRDKGNQLDMLLLGTRLLGLTLLVVSSCVLADINFDDIWYFSSGGVIGGVISSLAISLLHELGATLVFLFLWGMAFTLFTGISWLTIVESIGRNAFLLLSYVTNLIRGEEEQTITSSHLQQKEIALSLAKSSQQTADQIADDEENDKLSQQDNDDDKTSRFNIHMPNQGKAEIDIDTNDILKEDEKDPLFSSVNLSDTTSSLFSQLSDNDEKLDDSLAKKENMDDQGIDLNATIAELDQKAQQIGDYVEQENSLEQSISDTFIAARKSRVTDEVLNETHTNSEKIIATELTSNNEQQVQNKIDHKDTAETIETSNNSISITERAPIIGMKTNVDRIREEVDIENGQESVNNQVEKDEDTAAFQQIIANEQAKQAALQNPFLVQTDQNLPKPTSPMPTLDLLFQPEKREHVIDRDALEHTARLIEEKLADYKIEVKVVDIFPGPVITRFELDLAPGVKVSRISTLSMDLARSLSAAAVRVVEVIPGKPYIGLELPNPSRETVYFSDVVGSEAFQEAKSKTCVVLGQDIAGEAVVADLSKMPHVLVAGTTGSGKSVGVNVMILSILYKATPEDVRFIMVDPKMLELSIYEGIPHLLSEVVTDMKDASNALRWCVGEMERRYKLMAAVGVRNLKGYNEKLKMAADAGHPIHDPLWQPGDSMDQAPPLLEKMPYIVVIVDEFADLIMVVGKKVEELIARLAQKARAAGIHLVLATQRPSVDVITGLIKANIPTRVAFTVSTKTDSRTILDQGGAESLLGMGDMLYLPPGSNHTVRVHGAFASDDDVHAVVNDWKARGKPVYIDEIIQGEPTADTLLPGEQLEGEEDIDPLYDQVVEFVTESRRGSVSGVQRRFKIGYNRAARIVEQLEAQGVVSSPGSNGNREVLAPPPPKQFDN